VRPYLLAILTLDAMALDMAGVFAGCEASNDGMIWPRIKIIITSHTAINNAVSGQVRLLFMKCS
jgi:hypothetical protein